MTGLLVLAAGAPVVFWLARNAAATGSPTYPIAVEIFGYTLFEGVPRTSANVIRTYGAQVAGHLDYWFFLPWQEKLPEYSYNTGHGLGPLFATFVVPGGLYALGLLVTRKARADQRRLLAMLLATIALLWASWWFLIGPVHRFGLPIILLLIALAAPFLRDFRTAASRWFGRVLAVSVLVFCFVAVMPKLQDLAHQLNHGEWSWGEYYHLPEGYLELPAGATVVNYDVAREGWNNFALMGPDYQYEVVSYRQAREVVRNWGASPPCPSFLVDRDPFQVDPSAAEFSDLELTLHRDATTGHGETRWRIWRVTAGGCGAEGAAPR